MNRHSNNHIQAFNVIFKDSVVDTILSFFPSNFKLIFIDIRQTIPDF